MLASAQDLSNENGFVPACRVRASGDSEFLSPEESAALLGERLMDPDIGYGVSDPSDDGGADLGGRIQQELDMLTGPTGPYG